MEIRNVSQRQQLNQRTKKKTKAISVFPTQQGNHTPEADLSCP